MRPASSGSLADCLPSVSGRGLQPSPCPRHYAATRNFMGVNSVPRRVMSSSFSLGIDQAEQASNDYSTSESAPMSRPERQPDSLRLALSRGAQMNRDMEGRSLAGRKKPLKINLDLALVSLYKDNSSPLLRKENLIFFKCFSTYTHPIFFWLLISSSLPIISAVPCSSDSDTGPACR